MSRSSRAGSHRINAISPSVIGLEIECEAIIKSKSPHVKSYYMKERRSGQPAIKRAASVSSVACDELRARGNVPLDAKVRSLWDVRRAQRCQRPKPPRHEIEWDAAAAGPGPTCARRLRVDQRAA